MRRVSWAVVGATLLLAACDDRVSVLYYERYNYKFAVFDGERDPRAAKKINRANCEIVAEALNRDSAEEEAKTRSRYPAYNEPVYLFKCAYGSSPPEN
jgi:hypothetical protein